LFTELTSDALINTYINPNNIKKNKQQQPKQYKEINNNPKPVGCYSSFSALNMQLHVELQFLVYPYYSNEKYVQ